jgi:hypothetical protein
MSLYSVGQKVNGVNTANTVMWQLKTAAGSRARIREIIVSVGSAPSTAPVFVLADSTALGTSTTSVLGRALEPGDPISLTSFCTAWSSAPTFATGGPFPQLIALPVTAGSGVIWQWAYGEELILNVSSSLCIANLNASGATVGSFTCSAKWQE